MSPLYRQTTASGGLQPPIEAILAEKALFSLQYDSHANVFYRRVSILPEENVTAERGVSSSHLFVPDGAKTQGRFMDLLKALVEQEEDEPTFVQETPPNTTGWESQLDYSELSETLKDLQDLRQEADQEEIQVPAEEVFDRAERLIRDMYELVPRWHMVELFPEGAIAITIPGGFRCSVMVVCDPDGSVLSSVNIKGKYRSKQYDCADNLPDEFLRKALEELKSEGGRPIGE